MEAAKEGEFELRSIFIPCSVPTFGCIGRRQKTLRQIWGIMNIEILEKNPNHCTNEMSTHILKALVNKSENKDKFQKKGTPYFF